MKLQIPRGTYDLSGSNLRLRQHIITDMASLAKSYAFEEIQTPIFEHKDLFVRSVGEDTDVVNKEIYDFLDKKGRSLALRPELTAPVARSYIQQKMYATNKNARLFYYGPAFRYERPQAGRFRQFHQFGVECFEIKAPSVDVEVISMAINMLKHFDLLDETTLKINTLADPESRKNYIDAMKSYLSEFDDQMCDDCKTRIVSNPLRVLDCKVCSKKQYFKDMPVLSEYLSEDSKQYFKEVLSLLDLLDIKYELDVLLVRGLDYYNDTVFEVVYNKTGQAILGGGRYDNLTTTLANVEATAFGFGIGIERFVDIILAEKADILNEYEQQIDLYYMPLSDDAISLCLKSMDNMRLNGVRCFMAHKTKSYKNNLKHAEKLNSVYAIIIQEENLKLGLVEVRNLISKEQTTMKLSEFEAEILNTEESHG